MDTQRINAVHNDAPPELRAFISRCRRRIFFGTMANRLLPAFLTAALVSLLLLLARDCRLEHPVLAVLLLILSLGGFTMAMELLLGSGETAGQFAAVRRNRGGIRPGQRPESEEAEVRKQFVLNTENRTLKTRHDKLLRAAKKLRNCGAGLRPQLAIAAAVCLLAWLVLPSWALILSVAGLCAALGMLRTHINSPGETAWIVDHSNGTGGTLLTAVDGPCLHAKDPVEYLFHDLVRQRALQMLASATCPEKFNMQRNRVVAAATGFAALAIAMVLLVGPPAEGPWNLLAADRPSGPTMRPTQPAIPTRNIAAPPPNNPSTTPPPSQTTKPQPRQPGNAPSRSGSSTGHHTKQRSAASAAKHELVSNAAYRKLARGAAGMAAGSQAAKYFSRLTRREKRNLAATIRLAEQKVLHDQKLLSKLQKLAIAASGSSAAAFSLALEQTRQTLRQQLKLAVPGHAQHVSPGKPTHTTSPGHGPASGIGGNSSGITNHAPGTSTKPETGQSAMNSGNVIVLHVPDARGSGNFAASLEKSTVEHRMQNVPERYRNLVRRYFSPGK